MANKDRRLSVVHFLPRWSNGGMERSVIDICTHVNRDKYACSIVVGNLEENFKIEELKETGISFKALNKNRAYDFIDVLKSFDRFLSDDGKTDIIHLHINNSIGLLFSWIARKHGISVVVAHTHNNAFGSGKILLKKALRLISLSLFSDQPDAFFSCSESAGEWTFGKRVTKSKHYHVLYNGVNYDKYKFNPESRERMRAEYRLEKKFVIGHVGHFNYQKNQSFAVQVLKRLIKEENDVYHLVLVGSGERRCEIEKMMKDHGLAEHVTIVDPTEHIEKYYAMFDLLVLPSRFEGFGLVAVEAQYNGLHVICSDKVPVSVDVSGETEFIPIGTEEAVEKWEKTITAAKSKYKGHFQVASDPRFDIQTIVSVIEGEYLFFVGN
ncbi:MAG: glycosyltransferase [Bacillota bacterium]|nr:glycosyltransferase [Bacillota bacterium]